MVGKRPSKLTFTHKSPRLSRLWGERLWGESPVTSPDGSYLSPDHKMYRSKPQGLVCTKVFFELEVLKAIVTRNSMVPIRVCRAEGERLWEIREYPVQMSHENLYSDFIGHPCEVPVSYDMISICSRMFATCLAYTL